MDEDRLKELEAMVNDLGLDADEEPTIANAILRIATPVDTADIPDFLKDLFGDLPGLQVAKIDPGALVQAISLDDVAAVMCSSRLPELDQVALFAYGAWLLIEQIVKAGPDRFTATYGEDMAVDVVNAYVEYAGVAPIVNAAMVRITALVVDTTVHRIAGQDGDGCKEDNQG